MTAVSSDDRIEALVRDFGTLVGEQPAGVWTAPGRVNLIGEHTDYNNGLVLPVALQQNVLVAARRRSDRMLVARSRQSSSTVRIDLDALSPGAPGGWGAYVAGSVWALNRGRTPSGRSGLDLLVDGNVPLGAGLSSSAALECAVLAAAADLWEVTASAPELARVAQLAENDYVGAPTGLMDQMASMCCTTANALLFDVADGSIRQVPFDPDVAGLTLLTIDTRVTHKHADGAYGMRRRECEAAARQLGVASLRTADIDAVSALDDPVLQRRARHVVTEIGRVGEAAEALEDGDWRRFGDLMTASHHSLRDDFAVSCEELDVVVDVALSGGAFGARMTGGGFGGCAIALVPTLLVDDLVQAVERVFSARGWRTPTAFTVTAADGARRVL